MTVDMNLEDFAPISGKELLFRRGEDVIGFKSSYHKQFFFLDTFRDEESKIRTFFFSLLAITAAHSSQLLKMRRGASVVE